MRRHLLLFLLLCLHGMTRGQTQGYNYFYWFDDASSALQYGTSPASKWTFTPDASWQDESLHTMHLFVRDTEGRQSQPVSRNFIYTNALLSATEVYYWFDTSNCQPTRSDVLKGTFDIDASSLSDGLHILFFMAQTHGGIITPPTMRYFLKVAQFTTTDPINCLCSVDGQLRHVEKLSNQGGILHWDMDMTDISDGIHSIQIQAITPSGALSETYQTYFIRATTSEELGQMHCLYAIDHGDFSAEAESIGENGTYHFNHDLSDLADGLHSISYMLCNDRGASTKVQTRFFIKTPLGGNGIKHYSYWLNDDDIEKANTVTLAEKANPLQLMTLLPVESRPVRSSLFHFEVQDGHPMVFAKNTIHLRFYDVSIRFTDVAQDYVDYAVGYELTDIKTLEPYQRETIDWPEENTIKWYKLDAERGDSLRFHTDKACTMQLFSPSGAEVYNVSGIESVTWGGLHAKETGTYYLAIHDVTATQGTELSIDYEHIDKYAILKQDISVVGNGGYSTITFEGNGFKDLYQVLLVNAQADTITSTKIGHESDAATTVTFNFNDSPLGSYDALFIFTEGIVTIKNCTSVEEATDIAISVDFSAPSTYLRNTTVTYSLNISNMGNMTAYKVPLLCYIVSDTPEGIRKLSFEGLDLPTLYDTADKDTLSIAEKEELKQLSDEMGDLHYLVPIISSEDSSAVRTGNIYIDLPPNCTKTIKVSMVGSELIHAYFTLPDGWEPTQSDIISSAHSDSNGNSSANKSRRKVRWRCYTCYKEEVLCTIQTLETFVSVVNPYAGCILGFAGAFLCEGFGGNCTHSWGSALLGCGYKLSWLNYINFFDQTYSVIENCSEGFVNKKQCCSLIYDKPIEPVNSLDPNDIYGYEAKSGSRFVADSITALNYRIEFENDTTFATAAAHVVEVKDTLDRNIFDLTTYAPTSIKIGDKTEYLDGSPEFVRTMDMRPAINAIVQIEGKFDEQKGIATWLFTSLDPMTVEPTNGVMQGFLPVNYDGVSGIGEVSFNISRKAGLQDGTKIKNRAKIIFDTNAPIMTPTWTNIVDAVAPTSIVDGITMLNDSTLRVYADASDARSGVWKYEWYVQHGENAPWWKEGETYDDCFDFHFYEGFDYGFCVVVTDSAGNVEKKELARERIFKSYGPDFDNAVSISPLTASPNVEGQVYDLSGRRHDKPQEGINIIDKKKVLFRRKGK